MRTIFVKLLIKEECIEQFKEITLYNSQNSRKEPGNYCFDIAQSDENPCMFFLYELYESEASIEHHRTTEHYKKWRDTVADMMAEPRIAVRADLINTKQTGTVDGKSVAY